MAVPANYPPIKSELIDAIREGLSHVHHPNKQEKRFAHELIAFIEKEDQPDWESYHSLLTDFMKGHYRPEFETLLKPLNALFIYNGMSSLVSALQQAISFFNNFTTPTLARYTTDMNTLISYSLSPPFYLDMAISAVLNQLYCVTFFNLFFTPAYPLHPQMQSGFAQGYIDTFSLLVDNYNPSTKLYEGQPALLALIVKIAADIPNNLPQAETDIATLKNLIQSAPSWWNTIGNKLISKFQDYKDSQDHFIFGEIQALASFLSLLVQVITTTPPQIPPFSEPQPEECNRFYYSLTTFNDYVAARFWAGAVNDLLPGMNPPDITSSYIYYYDNVWVIPASDDTSSAPLVWVNRISSVVTNSLVDPNVDAGFNNGYPPAPFFPQTLLDTTMVTPVAPFTALDAAAIYYFINGDGSHIWSTLEVIDDLANPPDPNHPTAIYGDIYATGIYTFLRNAVIHFYIVWANNPDSE